MKESQTENDITVRWDMGLNQKRLAWFSMPKLESGEVRLAVGDELRLRFLGATNSGLGGMKGLQALNKGGWGNSSSTEKGWEGVGSVIKTPNNVSDEICLELRWNDGVPHDCTHGFSVDFVWKATSFDRMQASMKNFAIDEKSVSGYIVRRVEIPEVRVRLTNHSITNYLDTKSNLKFCELRCPSDSRRQTCPS